jgi:hypothetical protein
MGSCQDCGCELCIETLNLGHRKNAGPGLGPSLRMPKSQNEGRTYKVRLFILYLSGRSTEQRRIEISGASVGHRSHDTQLFPKGRKRSTVMKDGRP